MNLTWHLRHLRARLCQGFAIFKVMLHSYMPGKTKRNVVKELPAPTC